MGWVSSTCKIVQNYALKVALGGEKISCSAHMQACNMYMYIHTHFKTYTAYNTFNFYYNYISTTYYTIVLYMHNVCYTFFLMTSLPLSIQEDELESELMTRRITQFLPRSLNSSISTHPSILLCFTKSFSCMRVCAYVCMHVHVYVCMCVRVYVRTCVCAHAFGSTD